MDVNYFSRLFFFLFDIVYGCNCMFILLSIKCLVIKKKKKRHLTQKSCLSSFIGTTYKLSIIRQNFKIRDLCLRNVLRSPFYEQVQLRRRLLPCTFLPVSKHCQNIFLSPFLLRSRKCLVKTKQDEKYKNFREHFYRITLNSSNKIIQKS